MEHLRSIVSAISLASCFADNPEVSFEDLSLVEPATVAQHALRKGQLKNGDKVLIMEQDR